MEKGQVLAAFQDYEIYLASLTTSVKTDADAHAPIAEGKWSLAEIIMHLAEWDRFIRTQRLPHIKEGQPVENFPDVDAFNRTAVEPVGRMSFSEVLAYAQKERALLAEEIEEMDAAQWKTPFKAGGEDTSAAVYFAGIVQHDVHHRQQVDAFLT